MYIIIKYGVDWGNIKAYIDRREANQKYSPSTGGVWDRDRCIKVWFVVRGCALLPLLCTRLEFADGAFYSWGWHIVSQASPFAQWSLGVAHETRWHPPHNDHISKGAQHVQQEYFAIQGVCQCTWILVWTHMLKGLKYIIMPRTFVGKTCSVINCCELAKSSWTASYFWKEIDNPNHQFQLIFIVHSVIFLCWVIMFLGQTVIELHVHCRQMAVSDSEC